MSSQQLISDFLAQRKLALIGVSRSGRRLGNAIWKELRAKDYQVFPVHPLLPFCAPVAHKWKGPVLNNQHGPFRWNVRSVSYRSRID